LACWSQAGVPKLVLMASLRKVASVATVTACLGVTIVTQTFEAPRAVSVRDAYLPYQVVYDGFVVLELFLDKNGMIVEKRTLRDPGAMVPAAIATVAGWKFRPAEGACNTALPSAITTVFVYRPRDNGPALVAPPKNFKPVLPNSPVHADGGPDYVPAGVLSVAYPNYPVNSVAWGSVVVQVTVNPEGRIEKSEVLHGTAPFKDLVLEALDKWRFRAANLGGRPIPSKMPIAFVFQTPLS